VRADFVGYYVGLGGELGARPDVYGTQLTAESANLRGAFEHAWEREAFDLCALLMMHLHSWLLLTGRFGEIRHWLARLTSVEAALSLVAIGWLHHVGTRLALAVGDYEGAQRQRASVLANEAVENRLKALLCLEFVGPALVRNDQAAATAFLAEGRRWAGNLNDGDVAIALCKAAARLALAQSDWPAVAQQIVLAGFAAHEHSRPLEIIEALRWQAALLEALGEDAEAVECWELARHAAREQGASVTEYNLILVMIPLAARRNHGALLCELAERVGELHRSVG
jgi:hypothetical protein